MTIEASEPATSRDELVKLGLRWGAAILAVFAGMVALASVLREPLERVGGAFVEHFGYGGMALGTLLADAFHFPIPPQFYMVMAVTSGASAPMALVAITLGSIAGGFVGYSFSHRIVRWEPIARRVERSQRAAALAFSRYGYRAAILASLTPLAYSMLCYLAGINRLPRRIFVVLSLCRIPRLLLFFYLIEFGWSAAW